MAMTPSRFIEELTLNAWPPLETLLFDGWLLGFAGGYTRRANSVQPLYASTLALDDKIATCEAVFAARGRQITFKVTSSPADPRLDALLERRGYVLEAPTSVQTTSPGAFVGFVGRDADVLVETSLSDTWFDALNRLAHVPHELRLYERALLEKIAPPHCFASITRDGEVVALGLAVAERQHVGLFDIVVAPSVRNQGIGRRLCAGLLHWARTSEQAKTAYLAELQSNAPALHLYANLGFSEQYTYWYRTRPSGT
jgi:GNAT superfamily N-acetyltransferase